MIVPALLPFLVARPEVDLSTIRRGIAAAQRRSPVPGLSVAIVKDGKVVFAEGFGYADVAKKRRATAETVYAIGSVTKSFTALLATQAAVEGRLSLKDRPSKYLPNFHLKDPKTDARITLEDMLSHRSGLPRTDLVWYASDFSRDDLQSLVAEEEPTAPLGAAWQYQNLMFLFAGMAEEKAYGRPYETLLAERFFRPLGMAHSTARYAETLRDPLLATGYSPLGMPLRLKPADRIAPAGAIASNVDDMARYVQMLLADGAFAGKQVFEKEAVEETRKPRIAMVPGSSQAYGLGWMLSEEGGVKRVFHGGNIDGFTAMVTLVPAKGIGVVALSNGDSATLPTEATEIALNVLNPKPATKHEALTPATPAEMGRYTIAQPPIDLSFALNGKAVTFTQNGTTFPLELVGPKRYTLQKIVNFTFGQVDKDGKPALKVEQGGLTFMLHPAEPYHAPISPEALLAKTVEARGGAAAIRSHARYVVHLHSRMPSDAADQYAIRYRRDATSEATYIQFYSLNRRFAEMVEAVDPESSAQWSTFRAAEVKPATKAADEVASADLLADLEPARAYRSLAIVREDKVGDVPVYVLEKTPFAGGRITEFVSKADGRVLRRISGSGASSATEEFSDFRNVDGVVFPFHSVVRNVSGTQVVQQIDSIRFDERVPDWPWRIAR
jgi:CubicO group peptidase (beta-lactamase class C family)